MIPHRDRDMMGCVSEISARDRADAITGVLLFAWGFTRFG